jgi:signal transduction histidine kinase
MSHNASLYSGAHPLKLFPTQPSLRQKIIFGYLAVAVLILGVSLFTFEELKLVEGRILLGERISELFDTSMEIRRFERNYFLHRQEADYRENGQYIARMRDLLSKNRADFTLLDADQRIAILRSRLEQYGSLMDEYAGAGDKGAARRAQLEPRIRTAGKEIVTIAEDMVGSERQLVRSSLTSFRTILVLSIVGLALLMIAIGQALSRRVAQPLRLMEESVNAVSNGTRDKLAMHSDDREIVSIVNAINHLLKELDLRQKHLMRSEKLTSLGTMLSGVAHELNNPLSNIWTSCQLLLEELGEADIEAQRELLLRIDVQGERARNIVRSLLDFARDTKFRKESLPLSELVEQTVRFVKGEVPTEVGIITDIPDDIVLPADRQRLQQALLNLIRNGIEAVGKNGQVSISARTIPAGDADPEFAGEGKMIEIVVSDTGSGIAPVILPRIFDPFFTTKDVGKGMGLGLFIVHQIIEEHGGTIVASSEPGRGTTFRMRLPCANGDAEISGTANEKDR